MSDQVVSTYRFARLPEWMLFHPELSDGAVRVYGVLDRMTGGAGCFPGVPTVAKRMHKSPDTVRRAIRELERVGAVTVTPRHTRKGRQTSNLYALAGDAPTGGIDAGVTVESGVAAAPPSPVSQGGADVPPSSLSDNASESATDVSNDKPSDRTPGQEAKRVLDDYWAMVERRTGRKPVAVKAPQFMKLTIPFLEAGVTPLDLKRALLAMFDGGETLTAQGIERAIQRVVGARPARRGPGGRVDVMDQLRAMQFDAEGNIISRAEPA